MSELKQEEQLDKKRKVWVALLIESIGTYKYYPTSICYNLDDDVDDLLEKAHKKMHIYFKDIDVIRLNLVYPKINEPYIKRDVMIVDALKKSKEIGIENSIDAPFVIMKI
jgi:hypothetical protein